MLPKFVPPGTSVASFFEQVLPDAHRALVAADASFGEHTVAVRVDEEEYRYTVRGRELSFIRESGSRESGPAHLWIVTEREGVAFFLADWMSDRRFAPSFVPAQGVQIITDPRVLKRLAQASGTIELCLIGDGAAGIPNTKLRVSAGGAKKHALREGDADAVIETKIAVFEKLLAGKLGPDEAIADSHVTVRGKKLVAMQFAFAVAPFFPAR